MQAVSPFPQPGLRGWERRETWSAAIVPTAGKDDDEQLGMLSRQQRGKVRRAVDQGLVAGPATRDEVAQLTGWVQSTFARQGLPPRWPAGAHQSIYDALVPTGACTATAVRRNGTLLAVSLDMVLGDLMIGWEMGMSDEGRSAGASLILHTANMRRARDLGVSEFDMLGAPTPGIAHYKRSLGADLRTRGYAQWEPGWLPSRRYLRRVSTLLPTGKAGSTT
jgi:CelD/BcsL family acetyltransferase involved in cellulose biosynthesis